MTTEEPTLAEHVFDRLSTGGWTGVEMSEDAESVTCPKGIVVERSGEDTTLRFFSFAGNPRQYYERDSYSSLVFPADLDMTKHLFFRANGNYGLSNESQFRKVINALGKDVKMIRISNSESRVRRFYGDRLVISKSVFVEAMKEAGDIRKRRNTYGISLENYLSNIAAQRFSKDFRKRTTYANKGEFAFLVDRLNLSTKRSRQDIERYMSANDVSSLEDLADRLIRHGVFSDDFLRRLNDFFIRERLSDIISLGRDMLSLASSDTSTAKAQEVQERLQVSDVRQLETLWQRYFESYLLYLIFSYKKIFPKIELRDVTSEKKYPDFVGINHYDGLDVIEIKTHLTTLLTWDGSHRNFYLSSEASKAVVQTTNYLDAIVQERFRNDEDRRKITNFTDEENLYHPRGIIVMSSAQHLTRKKGEDERLKRDFTKLRNSFNNLQILTFDEIIDTADEYLTNVADGG